MLISAHRKWLLLVTLPCVWARPARAADSVEINYAADAGCPDVAAFREELAARVAHTLDFSSPAAHRIRVQIHVDSAGTRADLRIEAEGREPTTRQFQTATCDEAVRALAFVAALALDSEAATAPTGAFGDVPAQGVAAPAQVTAAPAASPPANPQANPRATAPAAADLAASSEAASRTSRARREGFSGAAAAADFRASRLERARIELGPLALVAWGPAKTALFAGGVGISLARPPSFRGYSPSATLSLATARTGVVGPAVSEARFDWTSAELDGCPVRVPIASSAWSFSPCAAIQLGSVSVVGRAPFVSTPVSASRLWAAVGVSTKLEFRRGAWFADLGAGALPVLTRYQFVFQVPRRDVYDTPWIGFFLHARAGLSL